MRTGLLAVSTLSLAAAACFTPADPNPPTDKCAVDSDCPAPLADACAPERAVCRSGKCAAEAVPTVWATDPGACHTAQDCACQDLPVPACAGAFECAQGRCLFSCSPPCSEDADCAAGFVCDYLPGMTGERACQQGCREDRQCGAGETCVYESCARCAFCPCFGQCEPPAPECAKDADCGAGKICGEGPSCEPTCVPGCHTDDQCGPGQSCVVSACAACGCGNGQCQRVTPACARDSDCRPGQICGEGPSCERVCVEGCRTSDQCGPGMTCSFRECAACGCANGQCQPSAGCTDHSQCPAGEICGEGPSCERVCVPGCRGHHECGPFEICTAFDCDACGCGNARCVPGPRCTADDQCGPGLICGEDASCDRACVPGCRTAADCGAGATCVAVDCDGCGCNPFCQRAAGCEADSECGPGLVCEPGTGCSEPGQCIPGCHQDDQCPAGMICSRPACVTCPCPGTCEPADPCLDRDGDGFAAACGGAICDANVGSCDCDDWDPSVHPAASEVCGDAEDNDCDGEVDEGCACATGLPVCSDAQGCEFGSSYCSVTWPDSGTSGCCQMCLVYDLAPCPDCLYPGGYDRLGCPLAEVCAPCTPCSSYMPVCSTEYATLASRCEAQAIGATVLHDGACAAEEGIACRFTSSDPCPAGMYCRNTCPMCASPLIEGRCTVIGACLSELDCPAGLPDFGCGGGFPTWSCQQNRCVGTCSP